jgi:hypothetical protein
MFETHNPLTDKRNIDPHADALIEEYRAKEKIAEEEYNASKPANEDNKSSLN